MIPVALFEKGYVDLISVIPPNAQLSPSSKITASQLGKVPGVRYANGTWGGFNWRKHLTTLEDVKTWARNGANIGLRAGRFPGLDIDSMSEGFGDYVQEAALLTLGPAPVRFGKRPKRLLMYAAPEPFARMRMWAEKDGATHLVELLGEGQQYLVHGTHPATKQSYEWNQEIPAANELTRITVASAVGFFDGLARALSVMGYKVHREGDGRATQRAATSDQSDLRAPSIDALREAVALIPNSDDQFPTRESYIKMGYAIRAATGDELEEGLEVFSDWAERWDNARGNDPETVRSDWRRMRAPFSIGWGYIAELARAHGYDDLAYTFEADENAAPPPSVTVAPPRTKYTDQWLADQTVKRIGERLRYAPETGRWLVWDSKRWKVDELLAAQAEIGAVLHDIATEVIQLAGTGRSLKDAVKEAKRVESYGTLQNVMGLVRADRSIAVSVDALDSDPWLLNTPAGVVDLRLGVLADADPDWMCTRITSTSPEMHGACPHWLAYLKLATGGDVELQAYLQRLAGYVMTGLTHEQVFVFLWGDGGNGKTTYLETIAEILGDYHEVAAMDTFTASNWDKHTTDLADLMGARLVTAAETQSGRRWDEQRVKQLTGGERIKARFMRQDNFVYRPAFKLVFMGNHKPQVRDTDEALRRRVHMVPFTYKIRELVPLVLEYREKLLRPEYPAILQWMIDGCLEWQKGGLRPPDLVLAATKEYFEEEDSVGRWLKEKCALDGAIDAATAELYQSWREWCGETGEYVGSIKRFSQTLVAHGFKRMHTENGSRFIGIQVLPLSWEPGGSK